MKIAGFIILGMAIGYKLLLLGEFELVLLGGATFGLLLYIAITISNKGNRCVSSMTTAAV